MGTGNKVRAAIAEQLAQRSVAIDFAWCRTLATRISFMNELSRLAERVGVDIERVRQGVASDPRIGLHFLYADVCYGGSCFPKDVKALARSAAEAGCPLQLLAAVEAANEQPKLARPPAARASAPTTR